MKLKKIHCLTVLCLCVSHASSDIEPSITYQPNRLHKETRRELRKIISGLKSEAHRLGLPNITGREILYLMEYLFPIRIAYTNEIRQSNLDTLSMQAGDLELYAFKTCAGQLLSLLSQLQENSNGAQILQIMLSLCPGSKSTLIGTRISWNFDREIDDFLRHKAQYMTDWEYTNKCLPRIDFKHIFKYIAAQNKTISQCILGVSIKNDAQLATLLKLLQEVVANPNFSSWTDASIEIDQVRSALYTQKEYRSFYALCGEILDLLYQTADFPQIEINLELPGEMRKILVNNREQFFVLLKRGILFCSADGIRCKQGPLPHCHKLCLHELFAQELQGVDLCKSEVYVIGGELPIDQSTTLNYRVAPTNAHYYLESDRLTFKENGKVQYAAKVSFVDKSEKYAYTEHRPITQTGLPRLTIEELRIGEHILISDMCHQLGTFLFDALQWLRDQISDPSVVREIIADQQSAEGFRAEIAKKFQLTNPKKVRFLD